MPLLPMNAWNAALAWMPARQKPSASANKSSFLYREYLKLNDHSNKKASL
jgi:hypothetical protein